MVPHGYVGTEEKAHLTTGNMALLCWATLWISSRSSQIHSPSRAEGEYDNDAHGHHHTNS